uniref:Importin 5 n=1 Tax=Rhizophora mucronata TaxID=61149 RepID=A0A2P2MRU1_RHIMU
MPLWVILDVQQHPHQYCKQPADELRQLPHHTGGPLSGLSQGNNKLNGQVAGAFFQSLGLCNLQHGTHHVHQLPPHKPRLRTGQLDQELQGLLRGGLVAIIQGFSQRSHHCRQQVLKAVPIGRAAQVLNEIDDRVQRGNLDIEIGGRS